MWPIDGAVQGTSKTFDPKDLKNDLKLYSLWNSTEMKRLSRQYILLNFLYQPISNLLYATQKLHLFSLK